MSRALLALFPVSGQTHFRSRYIGIDWKGDGFIGGGANYDLVNFMETIGGKSLKLPYHKIVFLGLIF